MDARLLCLLWAAVAPAADPPAADVLYEALHGAPETVDSGLLLEAPGRFVGRAVRTRGLLARGADGPGFELAAARKRAPLRLEPQAAAHAAAHASEWVGQSVEVEGFFYREARDPGKGAYALRTWSVQPMARPRPDSGHRRDEATPVSLEDLVYGSRRYDGRLVRVRGLYRGSNLHGDLPETTRKGAHDWVLKDGYFAVWITGREARGNGWDLTSRGREATDTALEVVGVPTTAGGIVRLAARAIEPSLAPQTAIVSRASPTGDAGLAAIPPHVSFAYPVAGEPLGPRGHMIVQFSKSMDPARFEAAVRVRYERAGGVSGRPRLSLAYRDRYRALVITPQPPPPPGSVTVLELLDAIIDVDGRALAPRTPPDAGDARKAASVVEELRFASRP